MLSSYIQHIAQALIQRSQLRPAILLPGTGLQVGYRALESAKSVLIGIDMAGNFSRMLIEGKRLDWKACTLIVDRNLLAYSVQVSIIDLYKSQSNALMQEASLRRSDGCICLFT